MERPAIEVTEVKVLNDGTTIYGITLKAPGQKPLDMRLSVFKGQPIQCESMEAARLADEMYGPDGVEVRWNDAHIDRVVRKTTAEISAGKVVEQRPKG